MLLPGARTAISSPPPAFASVSAAELSVEPGQLPSFALQMPGLQCSICCSNLDTVELENAVIWPAMTARA